MDRTVTRYVFASCALSVVAFGIAAALLGSATSGPWTVLAFAAAIAVAERVELHFTFDRVSAHFSLTEIATTAGLLLTSPAALVFAAPIGMVVAQISRRRAPIKMIFNIAVFAGCASVAAMLVAAMPATAPLVGERSVPAALVGMGAFVVLNFAVMTGLVTRLGGPPARESLRDQAPLSAATAAGTVGVGVILAGLVRSQPALVPFLLAPAAAVYLAAHNAVRARTLLESLRADHDRLDRVVDGASDGIVLLDQQGEVQVWNAAMERLTGLSTADVVDRPVAQVLTSGARAGPHGVVGRWLIDEAHAYGPRRGLDASLTHVDGTRTEVRESHALVFDERGRCTGDVIVVRDISRQRELERLRGDFVARVSHELRTPLTPIRGFAGVLLRRGAALPAEQRQEALERIVERSDHLAEVVEDLLLVTRLDQGRVDDLVHARPADLREVVEAATDATRTREPARMVTLTVTPGIGLALADPARVRQIVDVLLDNACRYAADDTPVEVELGQRGDDIEVRVSDHGPGVPRDQHEQIFEQFHRLEDPMTMRTSGVGLGLFIGRRLAQAMHGGLRIEPPRPAGGATFVLSLPTAEPVAHTDHAAG